MLRGKTALQISNSTLEQLKCAGLDIMLCRSQGYGNAASMAGVHGSVQVIIKQVNKQAIFNGYIDRSLNLCGQHSFSVNTYG